MTVTDCDSSRLSLGALVLGALPPGERERVANHVSGCDRCRAELAELAPLPGMLNLVRLDEIATRNPQPSPRLWESLVAAAGTEDVAGAAPTPEQSPPVEGRRSRPWLAGVGAAAAAVVAAAIVWAVVMLTGSPSDDAPTQVTASATDPATNASATVELTPAAGGTDLAVTLAGVPAGAECDLVVVSTDGDEDLAATWTASYSGSASVTGNVDLSLATIDRLDVTTDDGVLVSVSVP